MAKARVKTVPVQFRIEPRQVTTLREAAFVRAMQQGLLRPDVSGIVRDALDEWFARHPFKRPTLSR